MDNSKNWKVSKPILVRYREDAIEVSMYLNKHYNKSPLPGQDLWSLFTDMKTLIAKLDSYTFLIGELKAIAIEQSERPELYTYRILAHPNMHSKEQMLKRLYDLKNEMSIVHSEMRSMFHRVKLDKLHNRRPS